jgi:hypothetical protein
MQRPTVRINKGWTGWHLTPGWQTARNVNKCSVRVCCSVLLAAGGRRRRRRSRRQLPLISRGEGAPEESPIDRDSLLFVGELVIPGGSARTRVPGVLSSGSPTPLFRSSSMTKLANHPERSWLDILASR